LVCLPLELKKNFITYPLDGRIEPLKVSFNPLTRESANSASNPTTLAELHVSVRVNPFPLSVYFVFNSPAIDFDFES
jgi:hypothetical protein